MLKKLIFSGAFILLIISHANALPTGNYYQTCRRCHMSYDELVCNCQKANHDHSRSRRNWHWSSLPRAHDCFFVENVNGSLVCTGGRAHHHHRYPDHRENKVRKKVRNGNWNPGDILNG